MRRRTAAFAGVVAGTLAVLAAPAGAQTPPVRLAAAHDCARNVNCIPGFKRVYGIDPTSVLRAARRSPTPACPGARRRARRGRCRVLVQPAALAAGHPHPARRQADDQRRPHRPGSGAELLRRYGAGAAPAAERRLTAALHAGVARAQPAGHRRPAARGGRRRVRRRQRARRRPARRRKGPRIRDRLPVLRRERDARVPLRRGAARRGLPRQRPRVGGLRPETRERDAPQAGSTSGPATADRCSATWAAVPEARARRASAPRPLALVPGAGPQRLCDEARRRAPARHQLPVRPGALLAGGRAPPAERRARPRGGRRAPERAVGGRARQRARPARRLAARRRQPASPSPSSTPARGWSTPTWRRTSGPTSTRSPATAPTTTTTATSTTSTASICSTSRPGRTSPTATGTAPTSRASSPRRANGARRRRRRPAGEADDRQGARRRRAPAPPAASPTGIRYAAANGARVINLSPQRPRSRPARGRRGRRPPAPPTCCVVASAGNDGATSTASPPTRRRCPRRTCSPSPPPTPTTGAASPTSPTSAGSPCRSPRPARRSSPPPQRRRLRAQERHLDGRADGRRRRRAGRQRQPVRSARPTCARLLTAERHPARRCGSRPATSTRCTRVLAAASARGQDATARRRACRSSKPPARAGARASRRRRSGPPPRSALPGHGSGKRAVAHARRAQHAVPGRPCAAAARACGSRRSTRPGARWPARQRKVTRAAQGQARRQQGRRVRT